MASLAHCLVIALLAFIAGGLSSLLWHMLRPEHEVFYLDIDKRVVAVDLATLKVLLRCRKLDMHLKDDLPEERTL
jgi:hypothetical protein